MNFRLFSSQFHITEDLLLIP